MQPPFFLAALFSMTFLFQGTAKDASDTTELTRLENVWNEAHLRGDTTALAQLWEDTLVVIVPGMAPMSKADSLAIWQRGQVKFDRYQTSDIKIRLYGDTAIATGRLQRARTINGRAMDEDWRFTKTYIRQNGRWRVVAYHASPVAL